MNEKREPWRPTPSSDSSSVDIGIYKPSEAIRGAAQHAFNSGLTPPTATLIPKTTSSSARSAAAAAGSVRKPTVAQKPGQDGASTTTAGFAAAAYTRGRPPPNVARLSSNVGLLFGPTLNSPGSPAQQAARMASKSRSPARRKMYGPSLQDNASMPQDRSAMLAGKLASLRSSQDASGSPSTHSQTGTPPIEPSLNLKQIPHLPQKPAIPIPQDPLAGKLAGAAAAQAAAKHAQPPASPRVETREYFSLSLSSDRSLLGGSLEGTSTRSTVLSSMDSENSSLIDATTQFANDQPRSAPIPIGTTPRISPGSMASSAGTQILDHRSRLTERNLVDAIVAGSLASSRAPSPTKIDTSLNGSRRSRSQSHPILPHISHHFHHHDKGTDVQTKSSNASPRSLKHTLRKRSDHQVDDEDEAQKRGRKHFVRKHPHKHHEGDRKRWRDKVTERERRRYEGVWAANRGLYTFWEDDPAFGNSWKRGPEYDLVVNVVVRDIWERSRLPKDVLEEIWDLVVISEDTQALQRDQFVVGLWLIDQRLKGRKLPVRVSTDVWSSVRHTQGIKISRKPR